MASVRTSRRATNLRNHHDLPSDDGDDGHDTDLGTTDLSGDGGEAAGLLEEDPAALREVQELAQAETKRMRQWKILVVLGILLTGAAVSSGTYCFLEKQQDDNFRSQVRHNQSFWFS